MTGGVNTINKWRVPRKLTGNIFVYGKPGSGKSCKQMTVAQAYHARGYKIFDIHGGESEEGLFWSFPNDDNDIWKKMESETFEFEEEGPKQYNVRIGYPLFKKNMRKKLPQDNKNIKPVPFCIPLKDLEKREYMFVRTVLGEDLGQKSEQILGQVMDLTNEYSNGEDVKRLFEEVLPDSAKRDKIYTKFFKPLIQNRMLCSDKSMMKLDFEEEMKDKDTVFVLSLETVPKQFHFLVMSYMLISIFDIALETSDPELKKNLTVWREASRYMNKKEERADDKVTPFFRSKVVNLVGRYCRRGVFLSKDTQDASEVKGMISGTDDLLLVNYMPDPYSREETLNPLKKVYRMRQEDETYIASKMKVHEVCVVEAGKKARILKRIAPPRTKYWKDEHGSFDALWKREKGNLYIESEQYLSIIEDEYKHRGEIEDIRNISQGEIIFDKQKQNKSKKKKAQGQSQQEEDESEDALDDSEYGVDDDEESLDSEEQNTEDDKIDIGI